MEPEYAVSQVLLDMFGGQMLAASDANMSRAKVFVIKLRERGWGVKRIKK